MKLLTPWMSALLWLTLTATAVGQDRKKRVVVLQFEGRASAIARKHVVGALQSQDEVELVSFRDAEDMAQELGVTLDNPEAFSAVGKELQVDAFVEGNVERRGGRWVAKVRVRDAKNGEVVGREPWARRRPAQFNSIRGNFWKILGAVIITSAAPAQEPEPEPEPEPTPAQPVTPEQPAEPEESPRTSADRSALWVDVLPGLMWRSLQYNDADANLRSYHNDFASPAFLVGLEAEWYPGAHVTNSRWADLGVELDIDYALGLQSADSGRKVDTTAWDLVAGAVFRIPIDVFTPKLKVGFVRQVFDVAVDPDQVFLPNVDYTALRYGLGCAVDVTDSLELELGLAYIFVLDAGPIHGDRYFPRGSAGAIDLDSSIVYYLTRWMGLTVGVDRRRYGHDFKPDPSFVQTGGVKVAGGASDRYVKLDFGVRFRMTPAEP